MRQKTLLAGLLPFISNPVVLAVVGIGAVGMMLFSKENEQNNDSEAVPDGSTPLLEPLENEFLAVPSTVTEPLETVEVTVEDTVNSTVEELHSTRVFDDFNTEPQQDETITEEDIKKELIRQAMSELGKRSAAARAKKRNVLC